MPPEAVTVTVELPPKHGIAVAEELAVSSVGCVIVIEVVAVQPFASVTVKVYEPAGLLNVPVPL